MTRKGFAVCLLPAPVRKLLMEWLVRGVLESGTCPDSAWGLNRDSEFLN